MAKKNKSTVVGKIASPSEEIQNTTREPFITTANTSTDQLVSESSSVVHTTTLFQGPIPPAAELLAYSQIDPSFPNRILEMAEKEQEA